MSSCPVQCVFTMSRRAKSKGREFWVWVMARCTETNPDGDEFYTRFERKQVACTPRKAAEALAKTENDEDEKSGSASPFSSVVIVRESSQTISVYVNYSSGLRKWGTIRTTFAREADTMHRRVERIARMVKKF